MPQILNSGALPSSLVACGLPTTHRYETCPSYFPLSSLCEATKHGGCLVQTAGLEDEKSEGQMGQGGEGVGHPRSPERWCGSTGRVAAEASVLDPGGATVSLPTCPFQVPHPQASLWWVDLGCWQLQGRRTAGRAKPGPDPNRGSAR